MVLEKHAGPGDHPSGSSQQVHAGRAWRGLTAHNQKDHGNWALTSDLTPQQSLAETLKGRTYEERRALTENIKQHGIKEPIEVEVRADGSMVVSDGHQRLRIARSLGMERVPVKVIADLSKLVKHASPTHPGTGSDQSVHGGGRAPSVSEIDEVVGDDFGSFEDNYDLGAVEGNEYVVYHGTRSGEDIRSSGELHRVMSSAKWYTVTTSKSSAMRYSNKGEVIEFRIPLSQLTSYLWPGAGDSYGEEPGTQHAIRRNLPLKFEKGQPQLKKTPAELVKHASPTHPGTGSDQSVHGGLIRVVGGRRVCAECGEIASAANMSGGILTHYKMKHMAARPIQGERPRTNPFRTLKLPPTFWDDHVSRSDYSPGEVLHRTKSYVEVSLSAEEWADLKSDAEYYADDVVASQSGLHSLRRSAEAVLRRMNVEKHAATGASGNHPSGSSQQAHGGDDTAGRYSDDDHRDHILDWLERHEIPQAPDGRYVFYHGTPKDSAEALQRNGLRPKSLLESSPEGAQFFAQRDRDLSPDEVVVFEVLVHPWEINGGVFAWVLGSVEVAKEVMVENPIRKGQPQLSDVHIPTVPKKKKRKKTPAELVKHAGPIHPGTGSGQEVHGGSDVSWNPPEEGKSSWFWADVLTFDEDDLRAAITDKLEIVPGSLEIYPRKKSPDDDGFIAGESFSFQAKAKGKDYFFEVVRSNVNGKLAPGSGKVTVAYSSSWGLSDPIAGSMLWGINRPNIITEIGVSKQDRRRGLATAMLQAARLIDPELVHSTDLSDDAIAWSAVVKSPAPLSSSHGSKLARRREHIARLKASRNYAEPKPAIGDKKKKNRKRKKDKSRHWMVKAHPLTKHAAHNQKDHGNWARLGWSVGPPDAEEIADRIKESSDKARKYSDLSDEAWEELTRQFREKDIAEALKKTRYSKTINGIAITMESDTDISIPMGIAPLVEDLATFAPPPFDAVQINIVEQDDPDLGGMTFDNNIILNPSIFTAGTMGQKDGQLGPNARQFAPVSKRIPYSEYALVHEWGHLVQSTFSADLQGELTRFGEENSKYGQGGAAEARYSEAFAEGFAWHWYDGRFKRPGGTGGGVSKAATAKCVGLPLTPWIPYEEMRRRQLAKHGDGSHDESDHGNWADGIRGDAPEGTKLDVMRTNSKDELGHPVWVLSRIVIPRDRQGEGFGSDIMKRLIASADKANATISLTPDSKWGGSVSRLRKWYKSLGFVENKGRNRDFKVSESMFRYPKRITKHAAPIHPGTGSDQSVHGGRGIRPDPAPDESYREVSRLQEAGKHEEANLLLDELTAKKKSWTLEVKKMIALGLVTPEEAKEAGLYLRDDWQPLPDTLYHVTTAKDAVHATGLKTRSELNQDRGMGLGGGDSDTISFTTDPGVAEGIRVALLEARQVARGEITVQDMLAEAERDGYLPSVVKYWNSEWKKGDPYPSGLQQIIDGTKRTVASEVVGAAWFTTGPSDPEKRTVNIREALGEGATVDPNDEVYLRGEPQNRYTVAYRARTPEEHQSQVFDFYKTFAAMRDHATGRLDPLFFSSDAAGLANIDPSQIATLKVKPKPGARGFILSALGEWRTTTGEAVEVVR